MTDLLDMSRIALPDAVEVPDYATIRTAWLARYCEIREIDVDDLDDNDPIVKALEVGAYMELRRIASTNDSVRNTMLASATGAGLDDLGADPLYGNTERLVLDEGDPLSVPPVLPTYETDDDYRERLRLAPSELSVAGPVGAYKAIALSAHADVVDIGVTSLDACEIIIEVLSGDDADPDILDIVEAALTADTVRPVGDFVTVIPADREDSSVELTVYVSDGPDLSAVEAASQARVDALILPLCAKVRSGTTLSEGDDYAWLGACVVDGVRSWEVTATTGMSAAETAWWPMTITVTAVRSGA